MFDEMSDDALESELCGHAAHLSAGECHLLLLIAELDRRELWLKQGATSCAHWLSWRVGTALGAAREQLRVAKALERLPRTRAAFSCAELSYSKVRALTRVADEHSEVELVELARHATAAQLEQIVREFRRARPDEQREANARHHRRYLRHRTEIDGSVTIAARLEPDEAAVVLAAIELARRSMSGLEPAHEATDGATDGAVDGDDVSAESPGPAATQPGGGCGPSGQEEEEEEEEESPSDAAERHAADALVAMCLAVCSGGIDLAGDGAPPVTVVVHVDEPVLADPDAPGCAHVEGLGAITGHAAGRFACDAAVCRLLYRSDGAVEPEGRTRVVPRSMRRALFARDRGCRFPGCTARRFLHAHHVVYVSHGGRTALSNLVTLCGAHHRLVHDGGWKLTLDRAGQVQATAPDGTELMAAPAAPSGSAAALRGANRCRGILLDPDNLRGDGDRLDLGLAIDALLTLR